MCIRDRSTVLIALSPALAGILLLLLLAYALSTWTLFRRAVSP